VSKNYPKIGCKVVSVITYGLRTDIEILEPKVLELLQEDTTLLRLYRDLRTELTIKSNPETGQLEP
jgi:hypothetical protein